MTQKVKKGDIYIDDRPDSMLVWIHIAQKDDEEGFVEGPHVCLQRNSLKVYSLNTSAMGHTEDKPDAPRLRFLGNIYNLPLPTVGDEVVEGKIEEIFPVEEETLG